MDDAIRRHRDDDDPAAGSPIQLGSRERKWTKGNFLLKGDPQLGPILMFQKHTTPIVSALTKVRPVNVFSEPLLFLTKKSLARCPRDECSS